jgi:hypothetical protein
MDESPEQRPEQYDELSHSRPLCLALSRSSVDS